MDPWHFLPYHPPVHGDSQGESSGYPEFEHKVRNTSLFHELSGMAKHRLKRLKASQRAVAAVPRKVPCGISGFFWRSKVLLRRPLAGSTARSKDRCGEVYGSAPKRAVGEWMPRPGVSPRDVSSAMILTGRSTHSPAALPAASHLSIMHTHGNEKGGSILGQPPKAPLYLLPDGLQGLGVPSFEAEDKDWLRIGGPHQPPPARKLNPCPIHVDDRSFTSE